MTLIPVPQGMLTDAERWQPPPYTEAEYMALGKDIWSLAGRDDPTRFDDLLHMALAFMGAVALDGTREPVSQRRAIELLRAMQERVTNGPTP